jgi:hypothetical protein
MVSTPAKTPRSLIQSISSRASNRDRNSKETFQDFAPEEAGVPQGSLVTASASNDDSYIQLNNESPMEEDEPTPTLSIEKLVVDPDEATLIPLPEKPVVAPEGCTPIRSPNKPYPEKPLPEKPFFAPTGHSHLASLKRFPAPVASSWEEKFQHFAQEEAGIQQKILDTDLPSKDDSYIQVNNASSTTEDEPTQIPLPQNSAVTPVEPACSTSSNPALATSEPESTTTPVAFSPEASTAHHSNGYLS